MTQIYKRVPANPKQALKRESPLDEALNAEFFKALADPTRLKLLACLAKCSRGCSVTEVSECCEIDFSVVSRHLALLARAEILETTKKGRTVYYKVRYDEVSKVFKGLAEAINGCCQSSAKENCCKS